MNTILSKIKSNPIDYVDILENSVQSLRYEGECDIHVIIGLRGRGEFVLPLMYSLIAAIKVSWDRRIAITFVEHSSYPQHDIICEAQDFNYIWIKCGEEEQFSRGLSFNTGVLFGNKSRWILTHDLDCLVQKDFFDSLIENAYNHKTQALQSFNKRRVLYCNEDLSNKLIVGGADVNDLREGSEGIFTCKGEAPGGSIFMSRELFFKMGGYDPELFTGYAPEDAFLWEKMSLFETVASANNPVIDIFHLHHEFMGGTNPFLKDMIATNKYFKELTREEKLEIIEYKRKLIERWL